MSRDRLRHPRRRTQIAPSILSADFARLGEECEHTLGAGDADLLHIDVMDGHFVPNLTMGPAIVASLRARLPDACLDVHVMVTDPGQYIDPFAKAGADNLTFHIEPTLDPTAGTGLSPLSAGYDARETAQKIRDAGMTAGIALNPPTDARPVMEIVDAFDLVLVMSVNPGFSGQAFMEDALEKAVVLREVITGEQRLQMDGGIGPENADRVRTAGVDVLVAASSIFGVGRSNRPGIVAELRGS